LTNSRDSGHLQLLAGEEIEEVVEDGYILQGKAGSIVFFAILKPIGSSAERAESETTESDTKCRNQPNDRRQEDQKALGVVSALESQ
jgi:hypothetical protein